MKLCRWPHEGEKDRMTVLMDGGKPIPMGTTVKVRFLTWAGPNPMEGVSNGSLDGVIRIRRVMDPFELLHETSGIPLPDDFPLPVEAVLEVTDTFKPFAGSVLEPGETLPGIMGGRKPYSGLFFRGDFTIGTEAGSLNRPIVSFAPDVKIVLSTRGADWEHLSDHQLELLRSVVSDQPEHTDRFGASYVLQRELLQYTTRLGFPLLFSQPSSIDWWGRRKPSGDLVSA